MARALSPQRKGQGPRTRDHRSGQARTGCREHTTSISVTQDRLAPHTNIHAGLAASLLLGRLHAGTRVHGLGSTCSTAAAGRERASESASGHTLPLPAEHTCTRVHRPTAGEGGGQAFWRETFTPAETLS